MILKLRKVTAIGICHDDTGIEILEASEWKDEGKTQSKSVIFRTGGKCYQAEFMRSGSHFTDWHYGWDDYDDCNYELECEEVRRVEVTKHEWKVI